MKIDEVIIKEFDDGGYDPMGNVTTGMPSASPTNVAAPAGNQAARAIQWPTTPDQIKAFQKANGLKVDGLIGDKTLTALNKAGVKAPPGFKPVGNKAKPKPPNAGADARGNVPIPSGGAGASTQAQVDAANAQQAPAGSNAEPNNDSSSYTGTPTPTTPPAPAGDQTAGGRTNADFLPGAAGGSREPTQDIARLQQLGGMQPQMASPLQPAPAPDTQAAQAAPAAPSTVAPPVTDRSGTPVKTGSGGNVTTRSDDEIQWAQTHPYQPYPGPGWQEKQKAQGEKNWNAIKGFFGGKKQEPAAPAAAPAPGQGAQRGPQTPGGYGQFSEESSELTAMLKIAGLR